MLQATPQLDWAAPLGSNAPAAINVETIKTMSRGQKAALALVSLAAISGVTYAMFWSPIGATR